MNDRQKHLLKIIYTKNNGKGLQFGETLRIIQKENLDGSNPKTLTKDLTILEDEYHIKKIQLGEKSSHGTLYLPAIESNIILHLESFKDTFVEIFKYSTKKTSKADYDLLLEWLFEWIDKKEKEIIQVALLEKDGMTIYQIAMTIFEEMFTDIKKIIDKKITKKILKKFNLHNYYFYPTNSGYDIEKKFGFTFTKELRDKCTTLHNDMGSIVSGTARSELDSINENKIYNIIEMERPDSVDLLNRIDKKGNYRISFFDFKIGHFFSNASEIHVTEEKERFMKELSDEDRKDLLDLEAYERKRYSELIKTPEFMPKLYKVSSKEKNSV